VLGIKGVVKLKISYEGVKTDNVILKVVANETIKYSALLGRDILRVLGLGLTRISEETEIAIKGEILSIEPSVFDGAEIEKVDINVEMPFGIRERLKNNIKTAYLEAEKPEFPKVKAELELDIKNHQPFHFTPTRLSHEEKNKLRSIIEDLQERKVIRPSNSEYASRVVLIRKRNGGIRMCIDYRNLNKVTSRDNYPLPIIEEQIDALQSKRYFTLLDLKDGFHHVYMAENSIKYTSFITPFGQYEYQKMPFGLKNAPARFQRFVNEVLSSVTRTGNVVTYIDDFLIATETIEEYFKTLAKVFQLLTEN